MERLEEASNYATALLLIGIALSRDGDDKRVVNYLVPELLGGLLPAKFLRAIKENDRTGVEQSLAELGILMQKKETAVDAILRTHIGDAKLRAQRQLEAIEQAWKNEEALALSKVRTTGKEKEPSDDTSKQA